MGTKCSRVERSQGIVGAGASGGKGMEGGGAARSYGGDAPAVGEGGGRAGGAGLETVDGARLAMRFPFPSSLGPSKISLFRGSGSGAAGRVPRGGLRHARFLGQCSQNRVFWDPSIALACLIFRLRQDHHPCLSHGRLKHASWAQASILIQAHTLYGGTYEKDLDR